MEGIVDVEAEVVALVVEKLGVVWVTDGIEVMVMEDVVVPDKRVCYFLYIYIFNFSIKIVWANSTLSGWILRYNVPFFVLEYD